MRSFTAVLCLLLAVSRISSVYANETGCIVCTLLVGLVEQWLMKVPLSERTPVCQSPDSLCHSVATSPSTSSLVAGMLDGAKSPDELCQEFKLCDGTCTLFKTWPVTPQGPWPTPKPWTPPSSRSSSSSSSSVSVTVEDKASPVEAPITADDIATRVHDVVAALQSPVLKQAMTDSDMSFFKLFSVLTKALAAPMAARESQSSVAALDPCHLNVTCIINRVFDQHLPLMDNDGDNFAPKGGFLDERFRGTSWRGQDCNDSSPLIYPSRDSSSFPPSIDHNCNGIYGVDNTTGKSYEDMFCADTERRGVAIIGDSAAAHFHIPPAWLSGHDWNLDNLLPFAANELDHPECSWSTGFLNASQCPPSSMPMDSIYQRVFNRNRCNHRAFQSIAVNGARVTSIKPPGIIDGLASNPTYDFPYTVFFASIGNDVCNGHPGTSHMTTPAEFRSSVLASFDHLNKTLKAGSHVVIIPLVDGRVLYEITGHGMIHPIGVPYPDVYEFLICTDVSPCRGWLNPNATMRNITSKWAASLNQQYQDIYDHNRTAWSNFELIYNPIDWNAFIQQYVQTGGLARDLIEPVDGFHPSQSAQMLLAYNTYEWLEKNKPEALGAVNPHNADIIKVFGDQGGYE